MQQPQPVAQAPANQVPISTGPSFPHIVVAPPAWVTGLRIVQVVASVVVLGCCGYLVHGAYSDPWGFGIACSVITWVILAYILLAEHIASLHSMYNVFAVLSLDLFLAIMWLAAMGANAAHRAAFTVPVEVSGCYDDGTLIDSTVCWKLRKREDFLIAGEVGMAVMVVVCVVCALEFVLFGATFGKILAAYLHARKATAPKDAEKQPPATQFQTPVQPQTTGGTYPSTESQQAQHAGTYTPTPPPQQQAQYQWQQYQQVQNQQQYPQPIYEAPVVQERHAQEIPGAGSVSPCASPPQAGYGRPPQ